jgi:hypothetical protein
MSWFSCAHVWRVILKTHASPVGALTKARGETKDDFAGLERLTFGVTSVLCQCEKCFELRKEEMLGVEVSL